MNIYIYIILLGQLDGTRSSGVGPGPVGAAPVHRVLCTYLSTVLRTAPTDNTKPRQIIQIPDRLTKAQPDKIKSPEY